MSDDGSVLLRTEHIDLLRESAISSDIAADRVLRDLPSDSPVGDRPEERPSPRPAWADVRLAFAIQPAPPLSPG